MGELPPTNADGTLGTSEGFPYRLAPAALPDTTKAVRAGLGAVGLGLAVSTLFLTLTFIATPGVLADDPGGVVRTVEEQGFAWRDGIRSGQVVLAMSAADDPGGWRIETIDSNGVYRISSAAGVQAAVERTTIVALAAVIIAAIGLMLSAVAARASVLAIAWGAGLAAIPLAVSGDASVAWIGLAIAATIAGCSLAAELRGALQRVLVLTITFGAVAAAIFTRAAGLLVPGAQELPLAVIAASVVGVGVLWARRIDSPASTWRLTRVGDVVVAAALVILIAANSVSGLIPWPLAAVGIAVVLIVSPVGRRRISQLLDTTWLDGVRRSASIDARDEERSRVAADLHDAPLQEIAGVIARLEGNPAVDHERETLRTVSTHLREMVTGLEPPMLDHLGLVPALDYVIAHQQEGPGPNVTMSLRADASRPPHEVEVAAFRIAEEALRNATLHSRATHIVISGEVCRDHVTMRVADDGVGIGGASPRGGLALMPLRARRVGGRTRCLPGSNGGTVIAFDWPAQ